MDKLVLHVNVKKKASNLLLFKKKMLAENALKMPFISLRKLSSSPSLLGQSLSLISIQFHQRLFLHLLSMIMLSPLISSCCGLFICIFFLLKLVYMCVFCS